MLPRVGGKRNNHFSTRTPSGKTSSDAKKMRQATIEGAKSRTVLVAAPDDSLFWMLASVGANEFDKEITPCRNSKQALKLQQGATTNNAIAQLQREVESIKCEVAALSKRQQVMEDDAQRRLKEIKGEYETENQATHKRIDDLFKQQIAVDNDKSNDKSVQASNSSSYSAVAAITSPMIQEKEE